MRFTELADAIIVAFLPVISAVILLIVKKVGNKVDGVQETGDENKELTKKLEDRLKEAEGIIRGDLANGIKARLDSIDEKLPEDSDSKS